VFSIGLCVFPLCVVCISFFLVVVAVACTYVAVACSCFLLLLVRYTFLLLLLLLLLPCSYYKQKSGRMKSSGRRTGTTSRLRPQVQQLLRSAKKMIPKMDKLTMKQPPRWRCQTTIVVVDVVVVLPPSRSGQMQWLKRQSSSKGFPCHTMHRSSAAAGAAAAFPRVVVTTVAQADVVEADDDSTFLVLQMLFLLDGIRSFSHAATAAAADDSTIMLWWWHFWIWSSSIHLTWSTVRLLGSNQRQYVYVR
jgi:hypothetical protein